MSELLKLILDNGYDAYDSAAAQKNVDFGYDILEREGDTITIPFGGNYFSHVADTHTITGVIATLQPVFRNPSVKIENPKTGQPEDKIEVPLRYRIFITNPQHLPEYKKNQVKTTFADAQRSPNEIARLIRNDQAACVLDTANLENSYFDASDESLVTFLEDGYACYIQEDSNAIGSKSWLAAKGNQVVSSLIQPLTFAKIALLNGELTITLPEGNLRPSEDDPDLELDQYIGGLIVKHAVAVQLPETMTLELPAFEQPRSDIHEPKLPPYLGSKVAESTHLELRAFVIDALNPRFPITTEKPKPPPAPVQELSPTHHHPQKSRPRRFLERFAR